MKEYIKLTDPDMRTYKGFQWELNKWVEVSGEGELCASGWIHVYSDLALGLLLNPTHANFKHPRAFRCECGGREKFDKGLKIGVQKCRLVEELPVTMPTTEQCVRFGILCALEVYRERSFVEWATGWLDGSDRSWSAADAAQSAAASAADAASAAWSALSAAWYAARSAAWSATWYAARSATSAAWSAAASAADAASAAWSAAWSAAIDLIAIAHRAMPKEAT